MEAPEWSQWLLSANGLISSPVACWDSAEELGLRRTQCLWSLENTHTHQQQRYYVLHTAEKSHSKKAARTHTRALSEGHHTLF